MILWSKIKVSPFSAGVASGALLGIFWAPFWKPFGLQMAPTWLPKLPRRLQDDPGSLQDASYTPPGPPQHLPRRLQDRPQRAQDAPKALQEPPRRLSEPPRALQERVLRPEAASKSLPRSVPSLQPLPCTLKPLACKWPRRDARSVNNYKNS